MNMTAPAIANTRVDTLTAEIRSHLYEINTHTTATNKHRLAAGQKLLALRKWVDAGEAGDVAWWDYYDKHFDRTRRDAERLMAMAAADDPDAALAVERETRRQQMAKSRAADKATTHGGSQEQNQELRDTSETVVPFTAPPSKRRQGYDLVEHALDLVSRMTDEQRSEFDALYKERF